MQRKNDPIGPHSHMSYGFLRRPHDFDRSTVGELDYKDRTLVCPYPYIDQISMSSLRSMVPWKNSIVESERL